jgi:hypothetical protein
LKLPIALPILLLWSIYDIKQREIPGKLGYSAIAVVLAYSVLYYLTIDQAKDTAVLPPPVHAGVNLALLAMLAVVSQLGLLGWGDFAAFLIVAIDAPRPPFYGVAVFTPLLTTLFYFVLAYMLIPAALFVANLTNLEEVRKLPSLGYKILYMLTARPKTVVEVLKSPGWWYPLNVCGTYRKSFNIYLDPPDIVAELKEALRKGCHKPDDKIWFSFGVPGIPIIALAYLSALILGDRLLLNLITTLAN